MTELAKVGTELHVRMTEEPDGSFGVTNEAFILGTKERVAMRPTHIIGQLITSAIMIAIQNYDTLKADMEAMKTPVTEDGSSKATG